MQEQFLICKLLLPTSISAGQQSLQVAMKSPTLPSNPCELLLCSATCLLHPRSISVSNQPYWDSHMGFWSLRSHPPSALPVSHSSAPFPSSWCSCVRGEHCTFQGCIWTPHHPGTLTHWPQVEFPSPFQTDAQTLISLLGLCHLP